MRQGVLIAGSYGGHNLGDEMILAGMIQELKKYDPKIDLTVLSGDPEYTQKKHKVVASVPPPGGGRSWLKLRSWWTALKMTEYECLILGGGGLWQDSDRRAPWIWASRIWWAYRARLPIFAYAVGVGPLRTKLGRRLARWALSKCEVVTVRDEESAEAVEALGLDRPVVVNDPAFNLKIKKQPRKDQVVLSLRSHQDVGEQQVEQLVEQLVERGERVKLLVMDRADHQFLQRWRDRIPRSRLISPVGYRRAAKVVAESKLVIGMRYHSLVLASLTKTPYVAIGYDDKVAALVGRRTLGKENWSKAKLTRLLDRPLTKDLRRKGRPEVAKIFVYWYKERVQRIV